MFIKTFKHLYDAKNDHYFYFVHNPKVNVEFKDKADEERFFEYLADQSCSESINQSYIENTHRMEDVILVLVCDMKEYKDLRAIQGFSYIKPINSDDFKMAYRELNASDNRKQIDQTINTKIRAIKLVLETCDEILQEHRITTTQVYDAYRSAFFRKMRDNMKAKEQDRTILNQALAIAHFLSRQQSRDNFMEITNKYWKFKNYLYVCILCSNRKKAGFILDAFSNMTAEQQVEYLGFKYQAVALNGIDSAYSYYIKKGFKRSIDGITCYPYYDDKNKVDPIVTHFTGEYDGYLFVKLVDVPREFTQF